jgi:hypothetical protein
MRFARTWLNFAARRTGRPLFSSLKSVALRHLEHKQPGAVGFVERLKVFVKLNYLLLSLPFRLRRDPSKTLLLLNVPDRSSAERRYFIRKFDREAPDEAAIAHYDPYLPGDRLIYRRLTLRKCWHLAQAAGLIWRGGFADLFSRIKARPNWHLHAAQLLLQQILFHDPDSRIVLFFCYYAQTYLSSYVAAALLDDYAPTVVASNSILFENNRYLYHPDLRLRLCSRLQVPEVASYRALGWMQVREAELWGLEEVLRIDAVPQTAPTVDIGLFSSGFWARTETGWRVADIAAIRRGDYHGNRWFRIFWEMLELVAELKRERPGLVVKVYLHPYERRLHAEHGITPPYLPLLDANGIRYELVGGDSLQQFYESRIGLSSQSTIVFDRIHYGLLGFYYAGREAWQPIAPEFLGEYADMGFKTADELRVKLLACLD